MESVARKGGAFFLPPAWAEGFPEAVCVQLRISVLYGTLPVERIVSEANGSETWPRAGLPPAPGQETARFFVLGLNLPLTA